MLRTVTFLGTGNCLQLFELILQVRRFFFLFLIPPQVSIRLSTSRHSVLKAVIYSCLSAAPEISMKWRRLFVIQGFLYRDYTKYVIEETRKLDFNPSEPNDVYISRIAQLTSRRCILNIYSTNILTEYFKHAAHSPFFFVFKMSFIS